MVYTKIFTRAEVADALVVATIRAVSNEVLEQVIDEALEVRDG